MPQAVGFALAGLIGVTISATAATVIGTVAIGLGSVALSFGAQALLRPNVPTQGGVRPSDGQTELKQPLLPRVKSYGRVRVSGALWWFDNDQRNLYKGYALNHGRIGAIVSLFIDENEVDRDGSNIVTTDPYDDVVTKILSRLGLPTETAYAEILTEFGVGDVRGDGVASLLGIFENSTDVGDHQEMYPGGRPELRATIEASVCYDPRETSHDLEDQSTWEWSENLAVCVLNFLIDPDGYGVPWERIEANIAEWIAAMDICDEQVELFGGGTASRYRVAGSYRLTERPTDVLARMLLAGDARIWQRRNGSIGISVGKFVTPSVTISGDSVLSYALERGQDTLTKVAGIRAQYMSPDHDYREYEAEPWPSGPAIAALEEDRVLAMDLSWVPSRSQARRLMKREYLRQTAGWRGSITTNLAGLRAIDERFIRLQIEELEIDETFEVGRFTFDPSTMRCALEVLSVGPEIDDFEPEDEGSVESGALFSFASAFTKTGTAVDPIAEALGEEDQCAVVFVANSAGIAATPAGWTEVVRLGPTSGLAIACFLKQLDGSEASTIFLSGSGAITVLLFDGALSPDVDVLSSQLTTGSVFGLEPIGDDESVQLPYAVLTFFAANVDEPAMGDTITYEDVPSEPAEQVIENFTGASMSTVVTIYEFSSEETPLEVHIDMGDQGGTNGGIMFALIPGI